MTKRVRRTEPGSFPALFLSAQSECAQKKQHKKRRKKKPPRVQSSSRLPAGLTLPTLAWALPEGLSSFSPSSSFAHVLGPITQVHCNPLTLPSCRLHSFLRPQKKKKNWWRYITMVQGAEGRDFSKDMFRVPYRYIAPMNSS